MPPSSEGQPDSRRILRQLITAFSEPGAAHPGLAARIVDDARSLLGAEVIEFPERMPTLLFPRSAVLEVPDAPPVPPAAL